MVNLVLSDYDLRWLAVNPRKRPAFMLRQAIVEVQDMRRVYAQLQVEGREMLDVVRHLLITLQEIRELQKQWEDVQ